jgi:hypothetical protein
MTTKEVGLALMTPATLYRMPTLNGPALPA